MQTTKPREDWNRPPQYVEANKRIIAGVLALLFGSLGIHKFVLGYIKEGIIQILLNVFCGLGGIIGFVEGIIYLTKTDDEFYQIYQMNKKPWL